MTRHNQAKPDLEGYGQKVCVVEGGWIFKWVPVNPTGSIIRTDWTVTRSNFGEPPFDGSVENASILTRGCTLSSESELEPKLVPLGLL